MEQWQKGLVLLAVMGGIWWVMMMDWSLGLKVLLFLGLLGLATGVARQ